MCQAADRRAAKSIRFTGSAIIRTESAILTFLLQFYQFPLLVIDDLGIERSSEFAQEQVYSIVDSRYLSRLPFIITTNLALSELQNPPDLARARIYDRILERCVPICFSGRNYRAENAVRNKEDIARLLLECSDDIGQS